MKRILRSHLSQHTSLQKKATCKPRRTRGLLVHKRPCGGTVWQMMWMTLAEDVSVQPSIGHVALRIGAVEPQPLTRPTARKEKRCAPHSRNLRDEKHPKCLCCRPVAGPFKERITKANRVSNFLHVLVSPSLSTLSAWELLASVAAWWSLPFFTPGAVGVG